jgi:basic amino acid/polyamine antiporter, APA family
MSTTATPPSGAGLYTRKSSGLVRAIGIPAAIGINLVSVSLPLLFNTFNAGLTSFTQVDFYLPLLFGALIWLIALFAYRALVVAIPRAGGEYVYLSRIVSPVVGAMVGIGVFIFFCWDIAYDGHLLAVYVPFMLTGLGAAFNSASIANAANHVTSTGAIEAISLATVLIAGALALLSLKNVAKLLIGFVVLQVLMYLALGVLLIDHSQASFASSFAAYSHHPGAYESVITAAKHSGVLFGVTLGAAFVTIPYMVLAYVGVLWSYYVGGELRRPGRTYMMAGSISLAFVLVVWLALWALLRHTTGLHFMQAQANLGASDPATYAKISKLDSLVGGLGYGLVLSGDPITKILFATAVPVAALAVALAQYPFVTRMLFAFGFDRLLPVSVAHVSSRNNVPTVATAIAVILAALFTIPQAFVTNIGNLVALVSFFIAAILFVGGIAATFLAHRRPDLVKRPGQTDVDRWLGLPTTTWWGLATTALGLFTMIEVAVHPATYGKFSFESITTLALVLLTGPVIYVIARRVRKNRDQLDLKMAMHELPPE